MSSFIVTPTNVDYIESLFRDPLTGKWFIPFLTFNTGIGNPYYSEADPLNEDPKYQKRVSKHFLMKLTEKWLYKDPSFKSLLKYFKVEKKGDKGIVSLIDDPDKVSDTAKFSKEDRMYVYKYIEKYFITRRFIEKILRSFVNTTHIKWYDLFNNNDTIKDLFRHKLKKLIVSTIYELQGVTKEK